jgi:hypothetical protein
VAQSTRTLSTLAVGSRPLISGFAYPKRQKIRAMGFVSGVEGLNAEGFWKIFSKAESRPGTSRREAKAEVSVHESFQSPLERSHHLFSYRVVPNSRQL